MMAVINTGLQHRLWRNTRTPSSTGPCCYSVADVTLVSALEGGQGSAGAPYWINRQISKYNALWVLREAGVWGFKCFNLHWLWLSSAAAALKRQRQLSISVWRGFDFHTSWPFFLTKLRFIRLSPGYKGRGIFGFFLLKMNKQQQTNKNRFLFFFCLLK